MDFATEDFSNLLLAMTACQRTGAARAQSSHTRLPKRRRGKKKVLTRTDWLLVTLNPGTLWLCPMKRSNYHDNFISFVCHYVWMMPFSIMTPHNRKGVSLYEWCPFKIYRSLPWHICTWLCIYHSPLSGGTLGWKRGHKTPCKLLKWLLPFTEANLSRKNQHCNRAKKKWMLAWDTGSFTVILQNTMHI